METYLIPQASANRSLTMAMKCGGARILRPPISDAGHTQTVLNFATASIQVTDEKRGARS